MDSKFVNLPTKYKDILKEVKSLLNRNLITEISNSTISFEGINSLHSEINQICKKYECNSFDINRMIHGYQKKNSIIDILKKIASIRNKYIVTKAYKNPLWNENIKNLNERSRLALKNDSINTESTENAFLGLLKRYKYDWDGMWSTIETSKNGEIKNINVFDIDDFEILLNDLK